MSDETITQEKPITMVELSENLAKLEKEDELNFRSNKVRSYLSNFAKLKLNEVEEIKKKIQELDIPRLKERQIVKIIDLMPKSEEELKMLLTGETTTITDENIKKIVEVTKDHVKKK